MNVRRYMHAEITTVPPDSPLSVARDVMEEHGFGLLLICDPDGTLEGFITRAGLKEIKDWEQPIRRLSHRVQFSVSPSDTLEKAALIMLSNRLVLLPVVEDGKLAGVLSQSELLKGLTLGLGIGLEATRFCIRTRDGNADLYAVVDVLRRHGAHIVSLTRGCVGDEPSELIVRVQNVADKEQLRRDLETELAGADDRTAD